MAIDGLGYVENASIATNRSVISVFHQMHCLVNNITFFRSRDFWPTVHSISFGELTTQLPPPSSKILISESSEPNTQRIVSNISGKVSCVLPILPLSRPSSLPPVKASSFQAGVFGANAGITMRWRIGQRLGERLMPTASWPQIWEISR